MNDKTTEGFTATSADIEGMLRNLCAYALSDPDPLQRYTDLTHQQVLFDGVVAAIRRERGKALGDLMSMGVPVAKVAELAKLETPQRVKSLMTAAGVPVPSPRKPAVKRPVPPRAAPEPSPEPPPERSPEPVAAVAGKRTLTPDERRALGLPELTPIPRRSSLADR